MAAETSTERREEIKMRALPRKKGVVVVGAAATRRVGLQIDEERVVAAVVGAKAAAAA
jgi:hypothetical protein